METENLKNKILLAQSNYESVSENYVKLEKLCIGYMDEISALRAQLAIATDALTAECWCGEVIDGVCDACHALYKIQEMGKC